MKKILIVILLSLFISCTTTKYIEVPVETTKTEYIDRTRVDTFMLKDSVVILQKGDTVFNYKYNTVYRIKEYRDTVNLTDTIVKTKTVEVTKEVNKIKTWQSVLMSCGGVLIGGVLVLLVYWIAKLIKKWT